MLAHVIYAYVYLFINYSIMMIILVLVELFGASTFIAH